MTAVACQCTRPHLHQRPARSQIHSLERPWLDVQVAVLVKLPCQEPQDGQLHDACLAGTGGSRHHQVVVALEGCWEGL